MTDFRERYSEWRAMAFPPASADEAMAELHADLALADSIVAESVIPFVENGVYSPARTDVLSTLRELGVRSVALQSQENADDALELLKRYAGYAQALQDVYEGFLEAGPS